MSNDLNQLVANLPEDIKRYIFLFSHPHITNNMKLVVNQINYYMREFIYYRCNEYFITNFIFRKIKNKK